MEVITSAGLLKGRIATHKKASRSVGFVPTMGALHRGHLSLLETCRSMNDISVVSIFVNPTQFNEPADLKRYPRDLAKDLGMLEDAACDMAFCPDEREVYPEPDERTFDFGGLDRIMEGRSRPGHFNGVAQVVSRLLDMVHPDRLYLGMKDFQQVAIIRRMIRDLGYDVETVACPTVREADGLALSSRNSLLNPEQRQLAALIPKTLLEAKEMAASHTISEIRAYVSAKIKNKPGVTMDYFEVVDETTLEPVQQEMRSTCVACIAVRIGEVRLIDNMYFSS
jgi:pantoate--beta-alanine ligase